MSDKDETQTIATERGQDENLQQLGRAMAEAQAAFRASRAEGRKLVDEAWNDSIHALEQRLEVIRGAIDDPDTSSEGAEILNRQLVVVAEALGRCRAGRVSGYSQVDAQALANLRVVTPIQPSAQCDRQSIPDRIAAAARGFGRIPVIPGGKS